MAEAWVPLISGKLQTRPLNSDRDRYALNAELSLNPTRFVRHSCNHRRTYGQLLTGQESEPDWDEEVDPRLMLSKALHRRSGEEVILDGSDNILLTNRQLGSGRPEIWARQVGWYWRNVWSLSESDSKLSY